MMWPLLVEFPSASSQIRLRKKEKERRIPVKYESADNYGGRPNKTQVLSLLLDHSVLYDDEITYFSVPWKTRKLV